MFPTNCQISAMNANHFLCTVVIGSNYQRMIGRFKGKAALALWAFILLSTIATGQQTLTVTVLDAEGLNSAENVSIKVENKALGWSNVKPTDLNGRVVFKISTTGAYRVYADFSTIVQSVDTAELNIRANENATASLLVAPKTSALPEVVLSGERYSVASINTTNAEVSSELSAVEIYQLPVEGRDITRSLYRLPNISQATGFYPEAPNVAVNGANSLFTNYLIDGFDNNENFLGGMKFNIPVGFTDNIQVLTNNYSAEFGNTANGVINITTKTGSNETFGEVFYLTRPGPVIDASSPFAQRDLSGNQVKDGFQRQQIGVGAGGALQTNKTFYYLNFEQTIDYKDNLLNVPALGVNQTVRGTNVFSYLSGKVDHFWSNKWHSSVRLNFGQVGIERQGGGLEGGVMFPSAANTQFRNSFVLASKNEYFGDKFSSQTNYQYSTFNWNYAEPVSPNSPNVTVWGPDQQTIALLGHPGYNFNEYEKTHQVQQKFSFFMGDHTLKTGFEVKSSSFELIGGGNQNGSYTVQLTQAQIDSLSDSGIGAGLSPTDLPDETQVVNYSIELRPNSFTKRQNIYNLYVEDHWMLGQRLNLNIGLRYTYDNLSVGGGTQGDMNNIAPRFSFNYKLDQKSSIRGGYGLFYEKIAYALYSDALQFNSHHADYKAQLQKLIDLEILPADTDIDLITNEGNRTATITGVSYLNGPGYEELQDNRNLFTNELRILNPNGYDNPYSHQMMLGYQYQVSKNTLFYIDLVRNRSYNLFRVRNVNGAAAYTLDLDSVVVRTVDEADLTRPIPIENGAAVIDGVTRTGVARNVIMTESGGQSRYNALSVTLNNLRGEKFYSYRVSYTLSKLENNTEDINFRAMDANDFEAEWGPSINDRTHIINSFLTVYPAEGLSITLASLVQSGQPINRIPNALLYGTTDLNGDGLSFGDSYVGNSDRSPGEARNSDRLPWNNTFDISVQYLLVNRTNNRLELRADVFNMLNTVNLSGYSNNATQSNQIQIGASDSGNIIEKNAAPPRQFQFGLRYIF